MNRSSVLASFALLTCSLAGCDGGSGAGGGGSGGEATTSSPGGSSAGGAGGSTPSGGAGAGGAPGELVQVFVALGDMGRTTRSCDDGKTWIDDQSQDDSVVCFEPFDCDHHEGAGRGLAFGEGKWVAAFGWGTPGTIRTSKDGASWETVVAPAENHAGVAYGQGLFIANSRPPMLSPDGEKWTQTPSAVMLDVWNPRAIGFSGQNVFVITGETGDKRDMVLSNDGGQSWWHPDVRPDKCVGAALGITGGNGVLVAASWSGFVCTSGDGGKTWTSVEFPTFLSSPPVFTGTEIMVWGGGHVHRSADGLTWTSEPISPQGISIGPVARGPNGTFVAANEGWQVWYEKQQFYRSTDGVTWEVLDKAQFKGSHPITFIEPGWAEPSADCPLP